MQFDIDFAINILKAMESHDKSILVPEEDLPDDAGSEKYGYHCLMLEQAGFIEVWDMRTLNNPMEYYPKMLTYAGHKFLEDIRNKSTLEKVKETIKERGLPMTLSVISMVASKFIESNL